MDWADWGGRGGQSSGWGELVDATDYGILDGVDWGERGGWGGLGQTRRTGRRGAYGADWV